MSQGIPLYHLGSLDSTLNIAQELSLTHMKMQRTDIDTEG